jgi:competence protein ComEA
MKTTWLFTLLVGWLLLVSSVLAVPNTININEATAEALAEGLDGVGLVKAAAIVDYRGKNGPFKSIEDLSLVKGIGWKTVEANRERIRLSEETSMTTGNHDSSGQRKASGSAGPR